MTTSQKPLVTAYRHALMLLAGTGITATYPDQAHAQGAGRLEEVVVTATHREENLQDVPISVSALTSQDLSEQQIFGATEIANKVPGMSYAEFSPGQAMISMRGISSADDGAGMDNSAVMFLDGVYIGRLANINFEMFDLERIEVLRGPQGTLFGRNAIGGAINVTSTRPSEEFMAKAEVAAGNEGHLRYQGLISGPLSDSLFGKFSFSHREHDGYVDNIILGKKQQDENVDSFRGQLLFQTDRSEWLLSADYMEDDREDMGRVPVFPGTDPDTVELWRQAGGSFRKVTAPVDGDSYRDASGISLQGDIDFNSGTLITITALRDAATDWGMASIGVGWRGGVEILDDINEEIETFSQELRWTSNLRGNLNYVAGLYYLIEETDRTEQFRLLAPAGANGAYIDVGNEISRQENETTSYAAYIQGDWNFSDRWTLTLGARFTLDEKETESTSINCGALSPGFENYPDCAGVGGSLNIIAQTFSIAADDEWSDFSPKASLQFRQTDQVMWFATVAKGFKSGGFGGAPGTPEQAATPVDEEIAWNYELGMKGDFLDNSLRLNISAFYMDYQDLQVVRFGPTQANPDYGSFITDNLGKAEIKGLETEFIWAPVDNFQLSGNYTYLDTEVQDLVLEVAGGALDVSGAPLRQAPENKAALAMAYEMPLDNGAKLNFRVDYTYSDEQLNDYADQNTTIDEFSLWDARAAWVSADGNWQVALWGRNLTDEEYISHTYVIGPGVVGVWGPPRTYGLTLTWEM
ncbi:TonB-dependent receptor [Kineobactrum salinum]|uniref:TonB-dependent receptor n=1 Tax=Kineobactrum salinum TaxID=2708301 RepID=A0A6C0TYL8_9GAMM|nr:TonB-dependent receptor [Kineobactrum salinum]QIB64930.1 TonB-dependent receptor [Kineobactrum salinum]